MEGSRAKVANADLVLAIIALSIVPLNAIAAQTRPACPPIAGDTLLTCQVDVQAVLATPRPTLIYPSVLRHAAASGIVRASYVIDTMGRAWPNTMVIVDASHDLLTATVRTNLPKWRFSPALRSGRKVAVRVEEAFEFQGAGGDVYTSAAVELRRDSTPDGIPRTVIGWIERDSSAAAALAPADLVSARRAAVLEATKWWRGVAPIADVVVCVRQENANRVPADDATIDQLGGAGLRAVAPRDCPRTYESPFVMLDSLGRPIVAPPGWVDPHWLTAISSLPWSGNHVVVELKLSHGTRTAAHRCIARREGATWEAACTVTRETVS